jgi:membrane protein
MNQRLDNLFSWLAAAALVAPAVAFAIKREQDQREPAAVWVNPTPAQEPLSIQEARAGERGRGRRAAAPHAIPWNGWKDILKRTFNKIFDDRILALGAGVVFYSLLALFPAIAAGVSFYALFADAGTIAYHLSILSDIIPAGVLEIVRDEISRIAAKSDGRLTLGFLLSLGIAVWSANAGMKALFDALNVIYDEREKRGLIRLNAISLMFTIGAILGSLLALGTVVVFPLILARFGWTSMDAPAIAYLRWPGMFLLLLFALSILFRYGPSRRPAKWRWISVGSAFASLAWLAVSSLLSWYLADFANYNATYGALGAVVGMMMWMWLSTLVVLIGAELNSEMEHQTALDSTVGQPKPLGLRGAIMADTVGISNQ